MHMIETKPHNNYLALAVIVLLLAVGGYFVYQTLTLQDMLAAEQNAYAQLQSSNKLTLKELEKASTTLAAVTAQLNLTQEELDEAERDYRKEKRKNDDLEDEYRDTIKTVSNLNRLAQIDEELLQQYSRIAFLNENYVPRQLEKIDDDYIVPGREDEFFLADAHPFLEDLLEDAEDDDITLLTLSAYRSFDEQAQLKGQYLQTYGEGANTFSADQGFSEHQLGTAVDFTTPELSGSLEGFGNTEAYEWLLDNAYKHGFILSYPEGNDFYIFEPWHWRFVGTDLARDLRKDDRIFYEVPQRELDEYRLELFD